MKFFVVAFAVIATAAAAGLSSEYLPPAQESALPTQEYLPPISSVSAAPEEQTVLADDGYRYRTVKRYRLRHRRDVNELPSNDYLPPVQQAQYATSAEQAQFAAPVEQAQFAAPIAAQYAPEEQTVLADDGYRYKTVKRYRLRHRRDVNELSSNELPSNDYLPPVTEEAQVTVEPQQENILADDGYRYRTVKRYRLRHRRDVNELPSNDYLPPVQQAQYATSVDQAQFAAPVEQAQFAAPIEAQYAPEQQTVLADDGYRYRTVKRYRLRHRRDVNELPSNDYLPPVQQAQYATSVDQAQFAAPVEQAQFAAPIEAQYAPEQQTVLADDGYRYRTVKRYRLRHRRDVNELPSNDYLPPVQQAQYATSVDQAQFAAPVEQAQFAAPIAAQYAPEQQTVLADDGYRYKTVKRYRLRHRRDVNELPSNDYLPPVTEEAQFTVEPEVQNTLFDDGYRYRTVKRYRLRHRRDVNELPSNDYLPPVEQAQYAGPIEQAQYAPEEQTVLANDGYRYKTVKKYRLRRH